MTNTLQELYEQQIMSEADDKPVVSTAADGTICYRNSIGLLHRLDGPAVERPNGDKEWMQNGLLHRLDGPAIERAKGTQIWYKFGKPHRDDGPASISPEGYTEYWIDGERLTPEQFKIHTVYKKAEKDSGWNTKAL